MRVPEQGLHDLGKTYGQHEVERLFSFVQGAIVRLHLVCFVVVGSALLSACGRFHGQSAVWLPGDDTVVSTLAGSGVSGFQDGSAKAASFMLPLGLATDKNGNVYVADAAAQRIRKVAPNGEVATIAGGGAAEGSELWVKGGFRDGAVSTARFNRPSGIAVAPDGTLYIADMLNFCIRKISNGVVTTLAGRPGTQGTRDGTGKAANFYFPVAIAIDHRGNLFVADEFNGIRKVSPTGRVSTVRLPGAISRTFKRWLTGIAVITQDNVDHIFASNFSTLLHFTEGGSGAYFYRDLTSTQAEATNTKISAGEKILEGNRTVGNPFALAPLGVHEIAYTDVRAHTIRFLFDIIGAPLGPDPLEDMQTQGGGYADGPGRNSQFYEPTGIAVLPGNRLAVADSGNRRIRVISNIPRQNVRVPSEPAVAGLTGGSDFYNIAYVGNSYAYYDSLWKSSIPARLEARLNDDRGAIGLDRAVKVEIVQVTTPKAVQDYARTVFSLGLVDAVVWQLNSAFVNAELNRGLETSLEQNPRVAQWQARLTNEVKLTVASLQRARVPLLVVVHPMPREVSPVEDTWYPELANYLLPYEQYANDPQLLVQSVQKAHVSAIDLTPNFISYERQPIRRPLFASIDFHFSPAGDALVADLVADALERWRPWAHQE